LVDAEVSNMNGNILDRISDGRTDLVFEYVSDRHPATATDRNGVGLIKWCAYYGDVSAIRFLLAKANRSPRSARTSA
jgi:hypothetical protein